MEYCEDCYFELDSFCDRCEEFYCSDCDTCDCQRNPWYYEDESEEE